MDVSCCRRGKNCGHYFDDWLIALGDTTHIVVGSVEILYLVFNGTLPWSDFLWPFALPTLAGNICGGTFIFALMSHAQIRNDMSNKRKEEARLRGERRNGSGKSGKTALSGDGLTSQAALHLLRRIKTLYWRRVVPLVKWI